MLNLIKMDVYRLLHTISTWVMMVLVIAFTMVSGILISFNIMSIVYSLINKLIHLISDNADFDISHFMVDYNISAYNLGTLANGTFRAIAVGFIFVIISAVYASIIIEKRDVL